MPTGQNINYNLYCCLSEILFHKKACQKNERKEGKKRAPTKQKAKNCYFCGLHSNKVPAST